MRAILETSETDGPILKEWQGTKDLAAMLLPSEYERILKALVKQGHIDVSPVQMVETKDIEQGGFWPYTITVKTEPRPEGVTLRGTTLFVGGHAIKLGRGARHYTLQYWIVALCLKKPGKHITELAVLEKYGNELARSRSVVDATRKLNAKIEAATGLRRVFEYSNSHVWYNSL